MRDKKIPFNPKKGKEEDVIVVRGVPIPPRTRVAGSSKYNFDDKQVGDGFLGDPQYVRNIGIAAREYSKRNPGVKFVTRKLPDGKMLCVRES